MDEKVNVDTWYDYTDEINNIFGSACGRNRGIFVLEEPDGQTYSCMKLPTSWNIEDNHVRNLALAEPSVGVYALDQFIRAVYKSSIDKDIGACDFDSLSLFTCDREDPWKKVPWYHKLNAPIRAVNIGGTENSIHYRQRDVF